MAAAQSGGCSQARRMQIQPSTSCPLPGTRRWGSAHLLVSNVPVMQGMHAAFPQELPVSPSIGDESAMQTVRE